MTWVGFLMYFLTNCHYLNTEREPPKPKPRQRTLGLSLHPKEKIAESGDSQEVSRPQTSSASIPLSTDSPSNNTVRTLISHCLISQYFKGIIQPLIKNTYLFSYIVPFINQDCFCVSLPNYTCKHRGTLSSVL